MLVNDDVVRVSCVLECVGAGARGWACVLVLSRVRGERGGSKVKKEQMVKTEEL